MSGLDRIDPEAILEEADWPPGVPVSLAACGPAGSIVEFAAGRWADGRAVAVGDLFYGGSLAKQLTGAAVAVLCRRGRLDPDLSLGHCITGLPPWSATVSLRRLLHHLGGLPPAGVLEAGLGQQSWTNDYAIGALRALTQLPAAPGSAFAYSNAGYVCLGRIVAEIGGATFGDVVDETLLAPLGIAGMRFADGGALPDCPQIAGMGSSLPLSTGDGGLWTTAPALAHWLARQNGDPFGIAPLVESPGRLADGSMVPYGWGIGLRDRGGSRVLSHGGGWPGAYAKALRCPALGLSVVGLAADRSGERIVAVTDGIFVRLADALA